jgi:hypothetical protein
MIDDVPGNAVSEIDALILRIRGLVRVHDALRQRGMSDDVLGEHREEIGRLQTRLADQVRSHLRFERGGGA